jgi:hypothetical protein
MSQDAVQRALAVKRRREKELLRKANVVAVGVGFRQRRGQPTDEVCLVVSVKVKVSAAQLKSGDLIPSSIDNVPVDVVETGEIRALS